MRPDLISLTLVAFLTAPVVADGDPMANLWNTDWQLTTLRGKTIPSGKDTTLNISTAGVSGNGGCNGYSGSLTTTPNGVEISQVVSTMMACENLDQEQGFFAALEKTVSFVRTDDILELLATDGTVLARMVRKS